MEVRRSSGKFFSLGRGFLLSSEKMNPKSVYSGDRVAGPKAHTWDLDTDMEASGWYQWDVGIRDQEIAVFQVRFDSSLRSSVPSSRLNVP